MIFSYRVTSGQEHIVLDMLVNKIKKAPEGISAVYLFPDVKGYIFVEVLDLATARKLSQGIPHVKGVLPKDVNIDEIVSMAEARAQVITSPRETWWSSPADPSRASAPRSSVWMTPRTPSPSS